MDKHNNFSILIPLTTPSDNDENELGDSDREMNYSELKLNLIKMGYKEELIDHLNLFFQPQTVEDALDLMSKTKGVWQHNFIEDVGNKCLICHEESDHIDKTSKKNDEDLSFNLFHDNELVKRTSMTYDLILEKINNRKYDLIDEPDRLSIGEHTCEICLNQIFQNDKKLIQVDCQHYFCKSCWFDYLSEKIKNGEVKDIKCMDFNCDYILSNKFIMHQIQGNDSLVIKYDKFSRKKIVANNQNMKFCPKPNCEGYGEKKNNEKYITCSEGHNFCFNCMKDWHGQKDCQDVIDKDFEKWKKSKIIKQCPKCKYYTEKNEGCNHMTCRSCGADWCWLCQNICNPGSHYEDGSCAGLQFVEIGCLQRFSCFFFYKLGHHLLLWLFYYILFIPIYGLLYFWNFNLFMVGDCCIDFLITWVGISNFLGMYICLGIPVTILLSFLFIPALFYWPLLDYFVNCLNDICEVDRLL